MNYQELLRGEQERRQLAFKRAVKAIQQMEAALENCSYTPLRHRIARKPVKSERQVFNQELSKSV